MGPVTLRALAGLRSKRGAALVTVLALGLAVAIVLAAVAGSRRGSTALDRFIEYQRPGTITAFTAPELPDEEAEATLAEMATVPGAGIVATRAAVVVGIPPATGVEDAPPGVVVAEAIIDGPQLDQLERPIVLAGDLPLVDGEVAIDNALAERNGLEVGDDLTLDLFEPADLDRVGGGQYPATDRTETVRVGAVMREPEDLAQEPDAQPGTVFESDVATIVLAPDFWEKHRGTVASYGMGFSAEPTGDPEAVAEAMTAAVAPTEERPEPRALAIVEGAAEAQLLGPIADAIDLESNALLAIAALVALTTVVVLGPAVARLVDEGEDDRTALSAVGVTRRQVLLIRGLRAIALSLGAVLAALALTVPLSVLTPIGLARDAEIDRGVHVDLAVLALGALLAVAVIVICGLLGGGGTRPQAARAGRVSTSLAESGARPSTVLGCQLALEAASGRSRTAPRATIVVAVAGVIAVVGATTFAASLERLSDSPTLQGWTWDVLVGNYSRPASAQAGRDALDANRDVAAHTGYSSDLTEIDGTRVTVAGYEPHDDLGPVVLEGRAAFDDDEIALGRGTMEQLGVEIGDDVQGGIGEQTRTLRVVGEIVAPAVIAFGMDLDSGGAMTLNGLFETTGLPEESRTPVGQLVRLRDGGDRDAAIDRLRDDFPGTVLGPMKPLDVSNLERVRGLPYLLAAMLGAMALVSVVVMLVSVARRRRRDLAVLRAVGFDRAHLRSLLAAQSTAFTLLALLVGVPLGVVAGRIAWTQAADGLGTEVGPAVPLLLITVASIAVLVLANVAARLASLTVARQPTAVALRTE